MNGEKFNSDRAPGAVGLYPHARKVGNILYLSGVGLSHLTGNFNFLWIVIGVGFLQIISPFTKFCPVYFVLNKMMPDSDPIQNGK